MVPLSANHLQARVQRRASAGDIPTAIASQMLVEHSAGDGGRRGMIWFLNSKSLLRDEFGLCRLFRSWGGEALYNCHEGDAIVGPLLSKIGTPCIVVAGLPIDQIKTFMDIGEWFYASFASSQGCKTAHGAGMEGYIEVPLAATRLVRIITFADADFNKLTGASNWQRQIT